MTLPIVCSFGAGTQSSAIAQLVLEGRLPRPALWQFADTGEEPPSVYANLALFEREMWAAWEEHGTIAGLDSRPSLHKSGTPLGELDFAGAQQEMFGGWGNDCAGVCGV